ncbi:MAG: type II CRISPR RNA-guided endonuclease Cas9, partial [Sphingobacteriales bacterium]
RVRDKAIKLKEKSDFKGLPQWLASYVVYNRHSEEGTITKWNTAADIEAIDQHSLRNPIVEQVINETLQVVKSIWLQHGSGKEGFFDEIHVELGREMKNPAEKRRQITNQISENENTNLRIKAMLVELLNAGETENVRPYSPMQQEILKLYEEAALNGCESTDADIVKISKQAQPSTSDLKRYILWLQQKYRSPYTGEIIPLSKLFTRDYDIEHIIPQSRYFDDSLSNKVICETAVNRDKDKMLGYEYIKRSYGKTIELGSGKLVRIFTVEAYENFVREHYSKSRLKMKKLLMEEVPESFILRQLNDSRYVSKVVRNLMSNIVRTPEEQETVSKNVVSCNGTVTSILKQDWGLNDIWNDLVTPRFERLNKLTNSVAYGEWITRDGSRYFQTQLPLALQRGFSKKRIDHRHHALDAIVIACTTANHINYLNNQTALGKDSSIEKHRKRHDLKHMLCTKKFNSGAEDHFKWILKKPWETFTQDSKNILQQVIVSFKQNLRVINKTANYYQTWKMGPDGQPKKGLIKQTMGDSWAVRKPMHKDTVYGLVKLCFKKSVSLSSALSTPDQIVDKDLRLQVRELFKQGQDKAAIVKILKATGQTAMDSGTSRVAIYSWDSTNVASREGIDESFTSARIRTITDSGIQSIMLKHLAKFNEQKDGKIIEHPELAFNPDGIEMMNKTLMEAPGKKHHPIYKVRTFEPRGNKFIIGHKGNKRTKYVEAAKGTNLFFAIYAGSNGKRSYETIPLNIVIERQKLGHLSVPEMNELGEKLIMYLSPNDLIYVPGVEEENNPLELDLKNLKPEQLGGIYRVVSFTGNRLYALPYFIAKPIVDKIEFSQLNKMEYSLEKTSIREVCVKLKTDRLGNAKCLTR